MARLAASIRSIAARPSSLTLSDSVTRSNGRSFWYTQECPVDAIKPDTEPGLEKWLSLNAEYAKIWPNITIKKAPPPDSKEWEGKPDKLQYFSPNPGAGD